MMSTTGRIPVIAAPRPIPVKPASEIGVSITRSGPNSSTRPFRTLNGVPASATSSPMTKTHTSRRISSARASRTDSAMVSCRSATACSGIDIRGHFLGLRVRSVEGEFHAFGDLRTDFLFDAVQRRRIGRTLPDHRLAKDLHGVAVLRPLPLLVLRAVVRAVDVADVVTALPVSAEVQERRPITGASPGDRDGRDLVNIPDVLAIAILDRDAERLGPRGNVAGGRLAIVRVLVVHIVLAHVDDRKLPERGHVHALVEDSLAKRSLTEEARGDLVGSALLRRKCRAGCDAGASGHDGVRAQVALLLLGDVHRSTLAAAVAGLLPQ